MKLADLPPREIQARLRATGAFLRVGPFVIAIRSSLPEIAQGLRQLYAEHPLDESGEFADYHVEIDAPVGLRRWMRPQVLFRFDGAAPFKPLPRGQALPALEWGINWVIASNAHQYLILHAAVVAKDDRAAILPGPPGSGKSTLSAALVHRGWRLLSDELALIDSRNGALTALARPINLKNRSIDVIRAFAADAVFTSATHDTAKGTVALLRPPPQSVALMGEAAKPAWVVLPRYEDGAPEELRFESAALTFMELGRNAFNYSILGRRGFRTLANLIDHCRCFRFRYGALDDAVRVFDRLASEA